MSDAQEAPDATLDTLLWSVIDGEAPPWARRRAMRLLGSRTALDAELTKRADLDLTLLEWGTAPFASAPAAPATAAGLGVWDRVWRRLAIYPLQYIVAPATVVGFVVMAAALRFGFHGLYAIVANLVGRLP